MTYISKKLIIIPSGVLRKPLLASIALLLALALAACATETPMPTPQGLGMFTGAVNDELFIAVAAAEHPDESLERAIMVYLCDGADRSAWLVAESAGDTATLSGEDVQVTLSLRGNNVSGEVRIAGAAAQPFTVERAQEDTGLFRVQRVGPPDYIGGWIILNNFEQRGALTENGRVIENPFLDVATGTAETGVGTFSDITQLPCIPVPGWGCIPIPQMPR